MLYLMVWVVFGLIVGWAAKKLHPGEDPIGLLPTLGIGVAGSFLGGLIQWFMNMGGRFEPAGFLWSIVGGVLFCYLYRRFRLNRYLQIQQLKAQQLAEKK